MGDVFKNIAKLLGVALLAGVLGALGGILVNNFMGDKEPPSPPPATGSQTGQTITVPAETGKEPAAEETAPVTGGKIEAQGGTDRFDQPESGTTEAPAAQEAGADQADAAKETQPEKPRQDSQKKNGQGITETELKNRDQPADKTAREEMPRADAEKPADKAEAKTEPETATDEKPADKAEAKEEAAPAAEEKTGQKAETTPEAEKEKQTQEADKPKDESKSVPFDQMVDEEKKKEEPLQVRSVTASTVDQNAVLRVALDRSAEPKMSRLVGRGQLRIILDFEDAVREAGKVPDVIKTPNPAVKAIRIGAHPDKIRIVLDLDPELTYSLKQHKFSRAYVLEIQPQAK